MRVRVLLVLAALVLLAPTGSALPFGETFPSCYANSALRLVACETTYEDGTNCPGTSIAAGTFYGGRCNTGYGTHSTCLSAGATGELGLVSWCYATDHYGRRTTTLSVPGVLVWRSVSPGSCSMAVANAYSAGCPAGAPPSPEAIPLTWGYALP